MPPVASSSKQARNADGSGRGRRQIQYKGLFAKDLPMMMYGFGDARNPHPQSIDLMESLVTSYLLSLTHSIRPDPTHFPTSKSYPFLTRTKPRLDDLRFALRRDEKKSARLEELIYLEGVISGAKKMLSDDVVDHVAKGVEEEERQEREREKGMVSSQQGGGGGLSLPQGSQNQQEPSSNGQGTTASSGRGHRDMDEDYDEE